MSEIIKDFKDEVHELFQEALITEETPEQERAKEILHTVYAIIGNFFFMALSAVLIYLGLSKLLVWILGHKDIAATVKVIWEQHYLLVIFYSFSFAVGFLTVFAFTLKLLLKLYRVFGILELSKLYFFGEVVWLCLQYSMKNPNHDGPLPFFIQALRKLTGVD